MYPVQLRYPVQLQVRALPNSPWETFRVFQNEQDFIRFDTEKVPVACAYRYMEGDLRITEVLLASIESYFLEQKNRVDRLSKTLNPFATYSPDKAQEIALELIESGKRAKHFSILPHSHVEFPNSPISHFVLNEIDDNVIVYIYPRMHNSFYEQTLVFSLKTRHFDLDIPDVNVESFLFLVCASVIRDFWVRIRVECPDGYHRRSEKIYGREGSGNQRTRIVQKKVTYIPRVEIDFTRYQKEKKIRHDVRVQLSPHWISGHIRRLPEGWNASAAAMQHAAEFGFRLNPSETFVRPHEVGEALRTYRSRSALQLLWGKE
mgnify:CR=1 FL=1